MKSKKNKRSFKDPKTPHAGEAQLVRLENEHKMASEALEVAHKFLAIANRHMELKPLLEEFVLELRRYSGCAAVGVRLLDEDGNIPYQAYDGFSRAFYNSESPLLTTRDHCMCINVIKGEVDSALSFYTQGGSFYMNGTTRFLATVSEEEKGPTRNACNKEGYESVALIPIRPGDNILGLIHVADLRENMVPLQRVEVLESVAMQLGAAIQRVWAEEQLRQAHKQLEKRVEERTAELVIANRRLSREIEKSKRMQEALKQSARELRFLSSQLMAAQETERKRLAQELHDGIGQTLVSAKYGLEKKLKQMVEGGPPPGVSVEDIISVIKSGIEEVRRISIDLRPAVLDDLGILATINWFCREFENIHSGIRIKRHIRIREDEVPEHLKTVIYRMLQEATNNAVKHSGADLVHLHLRKRDALIKLVIEDNGHGFDLETLVSVEEPRRGFGIFSMRERVEDSGGTFSINSTREKGTTVQAVWKP